MWVLRGGCDQLWLIAVGGGEDDVRSRVDELGNHLRALRALGYVLLVHGLDAPTEVLLHFEAPDIMGVGPARVARSADVDERRLERVVLVHWLPGAVVVVFVVAADNTLFVAPTATRRPS